MYSGVILLKVGCIENVLYCLVVFYWECVMCVVLVGDDYTRYLSLYCLVEFHGTCFIIGGSCHYLMSPSRTGMGRIVY